LLLWCGSGILSSGAALPSGWLDADIGSPGLAGSAGYTNGGWTIYGGGLDLCSSDQFHLVYKPLTGDAVITARVASLANAPSGQAGVILRNDLNQGTPEVAVLATTNNGVTFQWRSTATAGCSYQVAVGFQSQGVPVWVRVVRSGNSFSGFMSTNGVDFIQVGSTQTVPLNAVALGGLAVTAGDNAALATANFTDVSIPPPTFGIYRQLWTGLNSTVGNSLAALTNTSYNPSWPNNSNAGYTTIYTAFETETNTGLTYYGQRLRTFVVPPLTGPYAFWVASDDTSELWLSSDEEPANAQRIAWVSTFTAPRQWTKETNQQSAPITLQAGRRYYLEAVMQQGTGNDNLAVRWQLPTGSFEEPLSAISSAGTWLIPFIGTDL
jgi:hypothetical protein